MTKKKYFELEVLAVFLMVLPIIVIVMTVAAGFIFPAAAEIYAGIVGRAFIAMFVTCPVGYAFGLYCECGAEEATE